MLYIILGIIQGLTEFLPVSSSGHLVLTSFILKIQVSEILPIIIICHMGTLLAVICFFFRNILDLFKDLVVLSQITIVTVITLAIALIGRDFFEQLFQKPQFVCLALFITAIFLILTSRLTRGRRDIFALNIKDAFWLGLSQGFSVIPGISRSGITIFTLLARGVDPQAAFKFSFIAGIPVILGSFLWEAKKIGFVFDNHPAGSWLALVTSFIFGLLGLYLLKRVVKRLKIHYFGYYLLFASIWGFVSIK